MPTNNSGTLSSKLIIQTALSLLVTRFPALGQITTDFTSGQIPKLGQEVISRIHGVPEVKRKTKGQPYISSDTNATDVPVVITEHGYSQVEFDIAEQASTDRNLLQEQAEPLVVALGNDFMAALFGRVTKANFTREVVCPVANVSRKTLVRLQAALTNRDVSDVGRIALLNLDTYSRLEEDDSMVDASYRGADGGVTSGRIMPTAGFAVIDSYTKMPTTENLLGFACNNEGLVIAARIPNDLSAMNPDIPIPGKQYVVQDKRTGLSVLVTEYIDLNLGCVRARVEWMFGTAIGNAKCLERLVSAATAGSTADYTLA